MTHKIAIKFFAQSDTFEPAEFVPIFHRWIQEHALSDHLLIDVADYAHVPAGPGSLLVASEANIHMDRGENRLGLLYVRKTPGAGAVTFRDHLRVAFGEALKAAALMESEQKLGGRLKFTLKEIQLRLNDRLNAPNEPKTFDAAKPDVVAIATEFLGSAPDSVEATGSDPRSLLTFTIRSSTNATVEQLLAKVTSKA